MVGESVLPALVLGEPVAAPVGDVERGIGEDEVGLEVGVSVVVESVAVGDLSLNAADGEVHLGQPPSGVVGLLAVDGDVPPPARLRAGALALPTPPQGGVIDLWWCSWGLGSSPCGPPFKGVIDLWWGGLQAGVLALWTFTQGGIDLWCFRATWGTFPPLPFPVACARMNWIDCTNMPEEPQQGS